MEQQLNHNKVSPPCEREHGRPAAPPATTCRLRDSRVEEQRRRIRRYKEEHATGPMLPYISTFTERKVLDSLQSDLF